MHTADELIEEAEVALRRTLRLPHQAASIALNVFLLSEVLGLAADPRVRDLALRLDVAIRAANLEEVLSSQLRYAVGLASAPGCLGYEEMQKLFSLCDEIHALRALGFPADAKLLAEFEASVRARFVAQHAEARIAARHGVEPWSRTLWWFSENLMN
jgi:hypothetical protein